MGKDRDKEQDRDKELRELLDELYAPMPENLKQAWEMRPMLDEYEQSKKSLRARIAKLKRGDK